MSSQTRWSMLPDPPAVPSRGCTIDVVFKLSGGRCQTYRQPAPRRPAIDVVVNLGGGRCWTHQQRPLGGPPSTSSSKLGSGCCRTHRQHPPGGSHQRRLRPQWWTLSDPPAAPLGAPPSMSSSKFSSRSCQTCRQHPQGPHHRCHLQNSVAEAARPVGSTPRGPAIDIILNLGGGRCRTHRQCP
jgi:hypothetical protein